MNLTNTQIAELRAAAEAATPGPWWSGKCEPADGHALAWIGNHFVDCEGGQRNYKEQENDATFIAQANPSVILALLTERDKLLKIARAAEELTDWNQGPDLYRALKEWKK